MIICQINTDRRSYIYILVHTRMDQGFWISLFLGSFYKKLKNVSCEYNRVNG